MHLSNCDAGPAAAVCSLVADDLLALRGDVCPCGGVRSVLVGVWQGRIVGSKSMWRDFSAIIVANLASFLLGEVAECLGTGSVVRYVPQRFSFEENHQQRQNRHRQDEYHDELTISTGESVSRNRIRTDVNKQSSSLLPCPTDLAKQDCGIDIAAREYHAHSLGIRR